VTCKAKLCYSDAVTGSYCSNRQELGSIDKDSTLEECKAACSADDTCHGLDYYPDEADKCIAFSINTAECTLTAIGLNVEHYVKIVCVDPTEAPTMEPTRPTMEPTRSPTAETTATAHGDPIIWTFMGECYDLNKDGLYVASSHMNFGHQVRIAIYNDFMREIQITNKGGDIVFSLSNLGETINNGWPFPVARETIPCVSAAHGKDCMFTFEQYCFDAQVFLYTVHLMEHDYMDPALRPGEKGVHLDVYIEVYPKQKATFDPEQYEGLYFKNPLPFELEFCPGGSEQRISIVQI